MENPEPQSHRTSDIRVGGWECGRNVAPYEWRPTKCGPARLNML